MGIVGADTTHAVEFARLLDGHKRHGVVMTVDMVFAEREPRIRSAKVRQPDLLKSLTALGVRQAPELKPMLDEVDAVLVELQDGTRRPSVSKDVLEARVPVFLDKPIGADLAGVYQILDLAAEGDTPVYSASALRYGTFVSSASAGSFGTINGCDVHSSLAFEEHHSDLYWYGIHGIEVLVALMGPDCRSVVTHSSSKGYVVVGCWEDGRIGTYRGLLDRPGLYGLTVDADSMVHEPNAFTGFGGLADHIAEFFVTRRPPVALAETVRVYEIMSAAAESRRLSGVPISVADHASRIRATWRGDDVANP